MVTYPKDWENTTLGKLGEVKMCKRIFQSQTRPSGQIPFYKIGTFGDIPDAYISRELFENYKNQYSFPQKGDVMISAAGTIGRTVVYDGKDAYFQDSNIVWLEVNPDEVDRKFLMYFYQSYPWVNLEGTTISRLYNGIIRGTTIHLPPLPEQKAIAAALDAFDTYIANLSELIEKKKGIRDGALEDLVSGNTRLKGFDREWITVPFDQYFTILKNNTYARDQLTERGTVANIHYGDVLVKFGDVISDNDDIPFLSPGVEYSEKWLLQEKDVIIADTAEDETVGKAVQVGKISYPLVGGLHTIVCRPNYDTATGFLGYYVNSKVYHDQLLPHITGIKVSSISKKAIKTTEVTVPKDVKEQEAIAEVLESMDSEISALEKEREKMIQIREGAMADLLTGKVRLSV